VRLAIVELAQETAERLGEIEGVVAVTLGGSWARGEAGHDPDVDLGIYYRDEHRLSVEDLRRLARELGYRYPIEPATGFDGWGPWINGGACVYRGLIPRAVPGDERRLKSDYVSAARPARRVQRSSARESTTGTGYP
jgi:predicted nucleotidyltransferase